MSAATMDEFAAMVAVIWCSDTDGFNTYNMSDRTGGNSYYRVSDHKGLGVKIWD